ncbi:MAG: hypothetical protein Q7U35_11745 [Methanobacteriaceae archaeon]|jgi:hypothetical protein|nr:hypothetical protein [Methanobacteriaceae archaeon]MDO9045954.1 hypothetical protein [Methanobacteriaceae archaeon]MDO9626013.1 hypothetical protein [Methanobacteriaceae archaeon]MDP2835820.1 hypothetical protein [Methanobacteriaceae archaeon]MDP3034623.1 hypothetical protein [Methanobacteriaceae archaeon]
MAMKVYDLVNKAEEIENATIYVENYTNKEDANGKEIHVVEINLEDTDTEKVTGPYILEADTKSALDSQVKFTLGAYFKKIDVVNKLY